jgi:hypothetical protein
MIDARDPAAESVSDAVEATPLGTASQRRAESLNEAYSAALDAVPNQGGGYGIDSTQDRRGSWRP